MVMAIARQANPTYGDNLSPANPFRWESGSLVSLTDSSCLEQKARKAICVLAICHYSSVPRDSHPVFSLSTREGATARTYVHVQMKRRMTSSNDWKLNKADWKGISCNEHLASDPSLP